MTDGTGFVVEQEHFRGSLAELAQALRLRSLAPEQLDLYKLVRAYLAYFEVLAATDLELATEALPGIAKVIELKLRLLLPRPPRGPDDEAGTEALDEALSAVAQLEELEAAILFLKERRQERRIMMPAHTPRPAYPRAARPVRTSPGDLARLAGRYRLGGYFELAVERLTLAGAMRRVMAALRRRGAGPLFALVDATDWPARTVNFGALLELVKQDRITAEQACAYGPIYVARGRMADAPSDGSDVESAPAGESDLAAAVRSRADGDAAHVRDGDATDAQAETMVAPSMAEAV